MKKENERGSMLVEASMILPMIIIVIGLLLYMAMLLYQKMQITAVANDAAVSVARVYAYEGKDPFIGVIYESNFIQPNLYRTTDSGLGVKSKKAAEWYGYYNLNKNRLIKVQESKVKAEVVKKEGKFVLKQVKVTVTEKYEIPLIGFFGLPNTITFKSTGVADCNDFIDYMNTVDMAWENVDDLYETYLESDVIKIFQNLVSGVRGE